MLICAVTTHLMCGALALAQGDQALPPSASTVTVPRLIRIGGAVRDEAGKPLGGAIDDRDAP